MATNRHDTPQHQATSRSLGAADRSLSAASRALHRAGDTLDRGPHGARRDVARALELMRQPGRQRGPERDHGPSR